MIETVIYLAQIAILCACIYMTWKARLALNGLGRGLILLFLLLVVRRIDDAFQILNDVGTLVLSSTVVALVAYDIFQIYRARHVYEIYWRTRKARIEELERQRARHEPIPGDWDRNAKSKV